MILYIDLRLQCSFVVFLVLAISECRDCLCRHSSTSSSAFDRRRQSTFVCESASGLSLSFSVHTCHPLQVWRCRIIFGPTGMHSSVITAHWRPVDDRQFFAAHIRLPLASLCLREALCTSLCCVLPVRQPNEPSTVQTTCVLVTHATRRCQLLQCLLFCFAECLCFCFKWRIQTQMGQFGTKVQKVEANEGEHGR